MSPRYLAMVCLVASAVWLPSVGAQEPGVTFVREGGGLARILLSSGNGQLEIRRSLWSNTTARTESGKSLSLTDPLMYNSHGVLPDGTRSGGYWNKPETFDLWQVEEVKDPNRPRASIVEISAEPPGFGLRKEATVAIEE